MRDYTCGLGIRGLDDKLVKGTGHPYNALGILGAERVRRISREGKEARETLQGMGLPVMEAEIPQLARAVAVAKRDQ